MADLQPVGINLISGQVSYTSGGDVLRPPIGNLTLSGGTPTDGDGGDITLTASAGVGTNRNGGDVTISAGAATGNGSGGVVIISSGLSPLGTDGAITFITGTSTSTEAARFDSGGTLYIGDNTAGPWAASPLTPYSILSYRTDSINYLGQYTFSSTATDQSNISLVRGRGTASTPSAVTDGDSIGQVVFSAFVNGSTGGNAASIAAFADGTVGTGPILPGRLVISTAPAAGGAPIERMRINNAGTQYLGDGTLSSTFYPANAIYSQFAYHNTHSFLVNAAFGSDAGTRPVGLNIKGRGTAASPSAVSPSDFLHTTSWRGITSASTQAEFVECYIAADDNPFTGGLTVSATSAPGRYTLNTTPNGSIIPVERLRINSFGTVFISDGTMRANFPAYFGDALSVYRDAAASSSVWSFSAAATTTSSTMRLGRGRGTADTPAIVQNGDTLGTISFDGATSNTALSTGASITAFVDGTPGSGDMPGRLVLSTTPDGSGTPSERLTIASDGLFTFAGNLRPDTDATKTLGVANVGWQALYLAEGIDTTAGDSATINRPCGRFRKDTSGTTFTLTNSLITANSIILLTLASTLADWPTSICSYAVVAGTGSATITFNAAPTGDADFNFLVINTD